MNLKFFNKMIENLSIRFNKCYSLFEDNNELQIKTKVQVMRIGDWSKDKWKGREITPSDLRDFVNNFRNSVLGQEILTGLPIDAEHNWSSSEEGACGWIRGLEIEEDSKLFMNVEWTDRGIALLRNKRFKHLSAMFADKYKDPETGEEYSNVLFGAALTVLPYISKMEPVMLNKENVMEKKTVNTEMTELSKPTEEMVEETVVMEEPVLVEEVVEETVEEVKEEIAEEVIEEKVEEAKEELVTLSKTDSEEVIESTQKIETTDFSAVIREKDNKIQEMSENNQKLEDKLNELSKSVEEFKQKQMILVEEVNMKEIESVIEKMLPSTERAEYSIKMDQEELVKEILLNAKKTDMYKFSVDSKEYDMFSAVVELISIMPKMKYNMKERGTIEMENKNSEVVNTFNLREYIKSDVDSAKKMDKLHEVMQERQKKLQTEGYNVKDSFIEAEKQILREYGIRE